MLPIPLELFLAIDDENAAPHSYPGGIFAPSLATGAGFGALLKPLFLGDPGGAVVLLGMVAYFTGVVRAPLTAVIIIVEATASRGLIMPLFLSALIAHAVSALICKERLYHGLSRPWRQRLREEQERSAVLGGRAENRSDR